MQIKGAINVLLTFTQNAAPQQKGLRGMLTAAVKWVNSAAIARGIPPATGYKTQEAA